MVSTADARVGQVEQDKRSSRAPTEEAPSTIDAEKQDITDHGTVDESILKDHNIVNWDGADDIENPLNWSSSKKIGVISVVAFITMLS